MKQAYALMHLNSIYTLKPIPAHVIKEVYRGHFRYHGFRDGQPWRMFETKKDFEREVSLDRPERCFDDHEQAQAARRAEMFSTHDGNKFLALLRERADAARSAADAK